jgi:ferric-dicitrate binding protein FerR (iron transport regulator)
LRLHRGSVRLVIRRHQGESFVVLTGAAEVAVLGTEFDVTAGAQGTEVRVVRGEVEVRNAQGRRRLWARESARVRPGEAPRMVMPTAAVIVDGPAVIERGR